MASTVSAIELYAFGDVRGEGLAPAGGNCDAVVAVQWVRATPEVMADEASPVAR